MENFAPVEAVQGNTTSSQIWASQVANASKPPISVKFRTLANVSDTDGTVLGMIMGWNKTMMGSYTSPGNSVISNGNSNEVLLDSTKFIDYTPAQAQPVEQTPSKKEASSITDMKMSPEELMLSPQWTGVEPETPHGMNQPPSNVEAQLITIKDRAKGDQARLQAGIDAIAHGILATYGQSNFISTRFEG